MMNAEPASQEALFPEDRPSIFSSDWRKEVRIPNASESDALLHAVRQQTRPFEKLKEATLFIGEETEAYETAQRLIEEDEQLKQLTEKEKQLLRRTLTDSLKNEVPPLTKEALADIQLGTDFPLESDDYLVKTSALIAVKVAEILNRERFLHDAFQVGDIQLEKQILATQLLNVLNENKKLRVALSECQAELERFQPTGLGLYKKKSESENKS
jgi:hypothetical protein